jgi:large subunit ribosomal protein L18
VAKIDKNAARKKRHFRIRKKISGTAERPRLNVFKSNKYFYAQVIDDTTGNTIVSASSLEKELKSVCNSHCNIETAKKVGELIAKRAKEKGLASVVFDRGGYIYHGKIKAFADSAREAGLEF